MDTIRFYNTRYGHYPRWLQFLIVMPFLALHQFFMIYEGMPNLLRVIYLVLLGMAVIYYIMYSMKSKNYFSVRSSDSFLLKLGGKKMDFKSIHMSRFSIQDGKLSIVRGAGIYEFDISAIEPSSVERLVNELNRFVPKNPVTIQDLPAESS
ncbi:MAG: hypothetical protein WBA16_04535 [Nonlabens sp.]